VPPRGLVEQERRHRARVPERLIVIVHEPLHKLDGLRVDDVLVVLGAESLRHGTRVWSLVKAVAVIEADREGLHRLPHHACHQRHDRARVDAPAEERPQRYV
jgi:hypothetical protein